VTDRKELDDLVTKARKRGAFVIVTTNRDGWIDSVEVHGLKGVGRAPMPPVAAAERLREALQRRKLC